MTMVPTTPGAASASVHDIEWFRDVPRSIRRHTIWGLALMAVTFGGFCAWGATAPLAAAVIAAGSFVATGENKIVQHFEGGIIEDILVSEGDHVTAGEALVKLDSTAAQVRERQLFLRQARLEATVARLTAQVSGLPGMTMPALIADNAADPDIKSIVDSQQTAFTSAKTRLESEIGLLERNIDALRFRNAGFESQRDAMRTQVGFLDEEFRGKMTLLEKGLVRGTEVKAIQRAMADGQGQIGRMDAEMSETQAQIQKFELQIEQTRTELREAALDELQSVETELDTIREQAREAENVLRRASIDAPVSGTVVRLYYHTSGGVIESGKKILEILPSNVPLIIESQVQRKDIDSVKVGQKATVRLSALNRRTTPILNGDVYYVSADALSDAAPERNREIYLARIRLSPQELARVHGFRPTPGMPVEVMIQTAERTFFDYLTKPIRDSMSRAFMEQ